MCRYVDALHDLSDVIIVRLTAILISRFLLNLRDAAQHDGASTYDAYDSHFSIPGFQAPTTGMGALTGNMGALLDRDDDSSDLMFAGLNTQVDNSSSEEGCPKQINYGSYDSPDTENHLIWRMIQFELLNGCDGLAPHDDRWV